MTRLGGYQYGTILNLFVVSGATNGTCICDLLLEMMHHLHDCMTNTAHCMKETGHLGSTFFIGNRSVLHSITDFQHLFDRNRSFLLADFDLGSRRSDIAASA